MTNLKLKGSRSDDMLKYRPLQDESLSFFFFTTLRYSGIGDAGSHARGTLNTWPTSSARQETNEELAEGHRLFYQWAGNLRQIIPDEDRVHVHQYIILRAAGRDASSLSISLW